MRNNNSLNGIYNQANDIGLAKKYLLIAINIFFIIVLVPSIFYNLFILADETNNHLFLALFEIILLLAENDKKEMISAKTKKTVSFILSYPR